MDFLHEIYRINNTLADLDDVAHFYWSRARPHRGPPSYDYRTSESGINCGGEMVLRFFQCTHEVASSFSNFPFPPLHSSTARTLGKGWDYPGRGSLLRHRAGPPGHRTTVSGAMAVGRPRMEGKGAVTAGLAGHARSASRTRSKGGAGDERP
jgi:hypothetical protein